MNTRIFSPFNIKIQAFIMVLVLFLTLVACGGGASSVNQATQPPSPTQANTEVLQPADTQPPVETQAPADTQAPAETLVALPTPTQPTSTLTSVCSLVTKEEAEAVLGTPVSDPVEQNVPPIYDCRYNGDGIDYVGVTVVEFSDATQAAAVFQMAIDINHYPEVSGIGDRAYRSDIYDITVDKGKYELSINVVNDESKDTRYEKARALAENALARLP
jgi:hypothetical protein